MLLAVGEHVLGDEVRDVVRYVTAFAGGVGCGYQELCGALSGGIAIIGGRFGRTSCDEDEKLAQNLARRFRQSFLDEFGCTQCKQVRELLKEPGGMGSCAVLVEWAANLLLEMISEAEGDG